MNTQKNKIILLIVAIIIVIATGIIFYVIFSVFGAQDDPISDIINSDNSSLDANSDLEIEGDTLPEKNLDYERGYEIIEAMEASDNSRVLLSKPVNENNRFIFFDQTTSEIRESKDYVDSEYVSILPNPNLNTEEVQITENIFQNYIIYKQNNIYNIFNTSENKNIEVPEGVDQVKISNYDRMAYFLFDKDSTTSQIYVYDLNTGTSKLISNRQNIKWIEIAGKNLFYQASLNIYRYVDNNEYPIAQGLETISIKLGGMFNRGILEVDGVSYLYDYTNIPVKLNQLAFYVDPKYVVWSDMEREFYTITETAVYKYNWSTKISTKTDITASYDNDSETENNFNLQDYDPDSMICHNGYIYINNVRDRKIYNLIDMTNLE